MKKRETKVEDAVKTQGDPETGKTRGQNGYLAGSFTIEAALVVPVVIAVIFLLLQVTLYLHDTVSAEAWLYQETWKLRWNEEQDMSVFEEAAAPVMAVLRLPQGNETQKGNLLQKEVVFETHLLPEFVTVLWEGMPGQTQKRSVEQVMSPWRFVRVVAAIREEWEERIKG